VRSYTLLGGAGGEAWKEALNLRKKAMAANENTEKMKKKKTDEFTQLSPNP
jgi:hypothetical protein